jgi:hypothetical protein
MFTSESSAMLFISRKIHYYDCKDRLILKIRIRRSVKQREIIVLIDQLFVVKILEKETSKA